MNQKFELGQIVATTALFNYCKEKRFLLLPYLLRHANCDWGSVCEEDKKENEASSNVDKTENTVDDKNSGNTVQSSKSGDNKKNEEKRKHCYNKC